MPLFAILALILLAGVSFFFALAESALLSLGHRRARELQEKKIANADTVLRLAEQPQEVLGTIVLGNTVSNAFIVAIILSPALAAEAGWATALWLLAAVLGLIFVCEVMPKALAVRSPETWAVRISPLLARMVNWSAPVRRLAQRIVDDILTKVTPSKVKPLPGVSSDEYADLIESAHQQGALAAQEKEILLQILSMDQRTAKDVMRPRPQITVLPDDLPIEEMIYASRHARHHRIPLYDESPDNIIGVLNTRTLLLSPEADLFMAVEFPSFVPESMNLLNLFEALQRQQRGLAVVLDEYGSFSGLVTLEDILEGVIGPIRHESEPEGFAIERIAPGRWRVNGSARIRDFRREFPGIGEVNDIETLGGLALSLAEIVPSAGEVFHFRGLRLTIKAADERRVRELIIESGGGTP
ncbi:MAG TPA: hemolysin family protein [Candidatus Limnocylindria bacterium]|jgi:CBS domain containing-hemolysin-like protein|nr:hemolysin family protein [Candidatus Limnocylindria bacterium]